MTFMDLMNMDWNDICYATIVDENREPVARIQSGKEPSTWFTISTSPYTGLYVVEKSCIDITEEYKQIAACLEEAWDLIKAELI